MDGVKDDWGSRESSTLIALRSPLPSFFSLLFNPHRLKDFFSDEVTAYMMVSLRMLLGFAFVVLISVPNIREGSTTDEVVSSSRIQTDCLIAGVLFIWVLWMDYRILRIPGSSYTQITCLWGRSRSKFLENFSDAIRPDKLIANLCPYTLKISGLSPSVNENMIREFMESNYGKLYDVVLLKFKGNLFKANRESSELRQRIVEDKLILLHWQSENKYPRKCRKLISQIKKMEKRYQTFRQKIEEISEDIQQGDQSITAFVTFDDASRAHACKLSCMRASDSSEIRQYLNSPHLKVSHAPPPTDINWDNLDVEEYWQKMRGLISSWIIVILGLCVLYGALYISQLNADFFFKNFFIEQIAALLLLFGYLFVFIVIPIASTVLTRRSYHSDREKDMLWQFCVFQVCANSVIPLSVSGLFNVLEGAILQGLLIDGLGVNIILEFLIPMIFRKLRQKRCELLKQAFVCQENNLDFPDVFNSIEEQRSLYEQLSEPDLKDNFGFSFRLAFIVKTVYVSMIFNAAYPSLVFASILHLIVQYVIDVVNFKIRYNRLIWIPFPSLVLPVIRYMLLFLPSVKLISAIVLYRKIGNSYSDLLPLIISLAVTCGLYWIFLFSDIVSEYRRRDLESSINIPCLSALEKDGHFISTSYRPPRETRVWFEEAKVNVDDSITRDVY